MSVCKNVRHLIFFSAPSALSLPLFASASRVASFLHHSHRLNMELDLQSLFGILCTAVLIG
jgi:hypothetical protein